MRASKLRAWEKIPYDYTRSVDWNRKNREQKAREAKELKALERAVKKLRA